MYSTTRDRARIEAERAEHADTCGAPQGATKISRRVVKFFGGLLVAAVLVLGLGMAGRSDVEMRCTDILSAGPSDATDAVTCAEQFPELAAHFAE